MTSYTCICTYVYIYIYKHLRSLHDMLFARAYRCEGEFASPQICASDSPSCSALAESPAMLEFRAFQLITDPHSARNPLENTGPQP